MEKISVIMSVFNEKPEWLKKSINSIINQTYKNIEFIIIFDNPDNTELKNILQYYSTIDDRIKLIINESNVGLIKSLNKALKICSGEFIARMDADDISINYRLEKQLQFLKENQNIDFVSSLIIRIDENSNVICKDAEVKTDTKIRQAISYYFPHPSWMFRRKVLNTLKEYKNVECAEDYDFTCRALVNDFNLAVINEYLLKYRIRKNGISKENELKQKINSKIIRKHYRKNLLLKKEYNPYNDLNNIKFNKVINKRYKEASNICMNLSSKNKIDKIKKCIKIYLTSKEYFKYNYLERKIIDNILKKLFLKESEQ